ncbi:MAG TPA: transglutaminase-like domain-containing protein [Bacteroidia bacterium]|jgi:regulator of sirC expression with transglutaminase-like and TPR domain|nr:transglutaminase-like domain-containing protein [Bacteroidia bacterium]
MDKTEVNALISLLDDPDEQVFNQIKDKLLSMGTDVIPVLESAWENSFDSVLQQRIENIIHKIQFDNLRRSLREWALPEHQDLLTGALLVARSQYPDIDEAHIRKHIEQIKQDIWLELNNNLTALEKVRVINHILFDVHGFSANTQNYHAPQNSYINNVLETKKGNPVSLSIIYAVIAQDLRIPIYGVNLPEHFILAYVDVTSGFHPGDEDPDKVLFYINPFSRGAPVNKKEIDSFLKQQRLDPKPEFFTPCSNLMIIRRLLNNLIASYEKLGYPNKVDELKVLWKALED